MKKSEQNGENSKKNRVANFMANVSKFLPLKEPWGVARWGDQNGLSVAAATPVSVKLYGWLGMKTPRRRSAEGGGRAREEEGIAWSE